MSKPKLLTWKPEHWPREGMMVGAKMFDRDGEYLDLWRVKASSDADIGDEVFVIQQGSEGPTLFGYGTIAGPGIKSTRVDQRRPSPVFPIRFTAFANPATPILDERATRAILGEKVNLPASGHRLTDEEANELRKAVETWLAARARPVAAE